MSANLVHDAGCHFTFRPRLPKSLPQADYRPFTIRIWSPRLPLIRLT